MKSFLCHFNRIRLNEKSRVSFLPFAATSQKASLVFDLSRGFKEKKRRYRPISFSGEGLANSRNAVSKEKGAALANTKVKRRKILSHVKSMMFPVFSSSHSTSSAGGANREITSPGLRKPEKWPLRSGLSFRKRSDLKEPGPPDKEPQAKKPRSGPRPIQ